MIRFAVLFITCMVFYTPVAKDPRGKGWTLLGVPSRNRNFRMIRTFLDDGATVKAHSGQHIKCKFSPSTKRRKVENLGHQILKGVERSHTCLSRADNPRDGERERESEGKKLLRTIFPDLISVNWMGNGFRVDPFFSFFPSLLLLCSSCSRAVCGVFAYHGLVIAPRSWHKLFPPASIPPWHARCGEMNFNLGQFLASKPGTFFIRLPGVVALAAECPTRKPLPPSQHDNVRKDPFGQPGSRVVTTSPILVG